MIKTLFSKLRSSTYTLPSLILALVGATVLATLPAQGSQEIQAVVNNRYGVVISGPSNPVVAHDLSMLQMGWWYEFVGTDTNPSGYNRVLLIRTPQSGSPTSVSELTSLASRHPGAYWMIGNEPNVPGQDSVTPVRYAELYNYYATNIRSIDPNAKLVAPNVLNWDATCVRCGGFTSGHSWVDSFRVAYRNTYGSEPPIDVWGIHAYYLNWDQLPMVDYQTATAQIDALRQYLSTVPAHSDKPIWVTEFGVIWGYDGYQGIPSSQCAQGHDCLGPTGPKRIDRIKDFMNGFLGWLNANADSKNIQKWFIYTTDGAPEPYSSVYGGISLFEGDGPSDCLSDLGMLYVQLAGGQSTGRCPTPTPTSTPTLAPQPPSGGGPSGGGSSTPTPVPTSTPTPTPTPMPTPGPITKDVDMTTGGDVEHGGGLAQGGGVRVQVPPRSVRGLDRVSITISRMEPPSPPPEGHVVGLTVAVDIRGPQGEIIRDLDVPITITFRPGTVDLEAAGNNLRGLVLGRWHDDTHTWIVLETSHDETGRTVTASTDHLTKFSVLANLPTARITSPADGAMIPDMAPLLTWSNPPSTTQYQIQVIPANNDGPGINLIRNADTSYQVIAPKFGEGNYVMLPGMSYTWRVRTNTSPTGLGENDMGWSNWVSSTFRTPAPSSATLSPVSPAQGETIGSRTPTLVWRESNDKMFYYEVQVSKDPSFNTDPATAVAMVYWELRHGGVTTPPDSYTVPNSFPLEPGTTYYWKVRPRVQGDGVPVAWSDSWSFLAP